MTSSKSIHAQWLIDIHEQISNNMITYGDACSEAIIEDNGNLVKRKIDPRTLKKAFEINNLPIPSTKPGRVNKQITEEVHQKIGGVRSKIKLGVSKTYERIIADAKPEDDKISQRTVYTAFKAREILECTMDPDPVKKFTTRYESESCDGIWHTDIHFFGYNNIVYLDDKSRKVVSWSQLEDKSSNQTKQSLEKSIRKGIVPGVIWTHCGKEFRGQFEGFMVENQIQHQTTEPYSPQQNGKN